MKKYSAFSLIELSIVLLIIGITLASVTSGSRLINEMRLSTARNLTKSSPVSSMTGVMLWLESTSAKSFLNQNSNSDIDNNDTVQYWYDINPQGTEVKSISQSTSVDQPIYIRSEINNLPVVRFSTSNTEMRLKGSLLNNYSTNSSIFIVMKYRNYLSGASSMIYALDDNDAPQHSAGIGSGGLVAGVWTGSANIDMHNAVSLSSAQPLIISRIYNRAADSSVLYKNGVLQNSTTASLEVANFSSALTFTLGNHPVSPAPIDADFGEIIIFDRALKEEERVAINQYLSKKWGI